MLACPLSRLACGMKPGRETKCATLRADGCEGVGCMGGDRDFICRQPAELHQEQGRKDQGPSRQ